MGQKKLIRFNEIKSFPNVLEYPENMKGKWKDFFKNNNPITLELACGKGEYAVGLGRLYPERNFLGMDIKGNRIWRGAKTALDEGMGHIAFIRSHIDKITAYFNPEESSASPFPGEKKINPSQIFKALSANFTTRRNHSPENR